MARALRKAIRYIYYGLVHGFTRLAARFTILARMSSSVDWKALGLGVVAGMAAAGALVAGYRLLKPGKMNYKLQNKSYYKTDPRSLYVNNQNAEDAVLSRLRALSVSHSRGKMTTGLTVGRLLTTLTRSLGARKVLDVGVFTGCSSHAMALGLPEGGRVIACDVSDQYASIGKPFWAEGGVAEKIDLRIQPAMKTLQDLIDNGESGTFDLVFIDADKVNYCNYYEMALELLRKGGLVVVDNAMWSGLVVDPNYQEDSTRSICALNSRMKNDSRVEYVLLDVSDGLGIACKK